jgi:hypothetical protein
MFFEATRETVMSWARGTDRPHDVGDTRFQNSSKSLVSKNAVAAVEIAQANGAAEQPGRSRLIGSHTEVRVPQMADGSICSFDADVNGLSSGRVPCWIVI